MATQSVPNSKPFLIFPTLSREYVWRIAASETNRTISRHKNLGLAIAKAERLNSIALMPAPQFAEGETYLDRDTRGGCQLWFDYSDGDARECERPASISDSDSGQSFCTSCWRAQ